MRGWGLYFSCQFTVSSSIEISDVFASRKFTEGTEVVLMSSNCTSSAIVLRSLAVVVATVIAVVSIFGYITVR
ncbi:MAG: hypothetical protein K2N34_01395 [Lachnospiraceae bacterium]|nr:hypothetical protein [Lachnospiraceae bacterium]